MASHRQGPRVGLPAEDWVRHWENDFAEFRHEHHHGDHHHHHEHHHGPNHQEGDERGCGSQKYLKTYLPRLTCGKSTISVLVTLCGNSSDVAFLASKGHNVTAIEISEKAVKSLLEDCPNPIPYTVSDKGPFKLYTATDGKKISIYVGNFFDTLPSDVGPFDGIWDGHGIISLPRKDMQPYADKLKQLLKPDGTILFSSVCYDVTELKGTAPASISTNQLAKFFGPGYKVELLENSVFKHASNFEGVTNCTNPINLVTKEQ